MQYQDDDPVFVAIYVLNALDRVWRGTEVFRTMRELTRQQLREHLPEFASVEETMTLDQEHIERAVEAYDLTPDETGSDHATFRLHILDGRRLKGRTSGLLVYSLRGGAQHDYRSIVDSLYQVENADVAREFFRKPLTAERERPTETAEDNVMRAIGHGLDGGGDIGAAFSEGALRLPDPGEVPQTSQHQGRVDSAFEALDSLEDDFSGFWKTYIGDRQIGILGQAGQHWRRE